MTGTDDGTAYHFEVKADNTVADVLSGLGTASVRESGTAYRAPDAPTGVYGVSGDSSVAVTWVAPADNGDSALTHYTVYTTPAIDSSCGDVGDAATCDALIGELECDASSKCAWDASVSATPHCSVRCSMAVAQGTVTGTVTGLTNGVWYRFTVTASNAYGTSVHAEWPGNCAAASGVAGTEVTSAACVAVTGNTWYAPEDPHGGVAPGTAPSAPTITSVVAHPDGGATIVSFSAPADDGGVTVGGYRVYAFAASSGGSALTIGSAAYWSV